MRAYGGTISPIESTQPATVYTSGYCKTYLRSVASVSVTAVSMLLFLCSPASSLLQFLLQTYESV